MEPPPFFPTPAGVRDMLPGELREISSLIAPARRELEARDFAEIHTPALEYESVMAVGDVESTEPAFRLLDDRGRKLLLRSDMTIPTARLVATRLKDERPPFRLYYVSHIYRGAVTSGHAREFLQLGAELIGRSGLAATLELLEGLVAMLDAVGLADYTVVLGDASLFPRLMRTLEIPDGARGALMHELVTRDFVGLRRQLGALKAGNLVGDKTLEALERVAQIRGAGDVFDGLDEVAVDAAETLGRIRVEASDQVRAHLAFDFGMSRPLGYYSGEIFEIHHSALGQPIGGGGRYDELLARFGRPLEAIGFGLSVEALHAAKLAEDAERKPLLEATERPT